jgi:TonB-dependent receptor-like protein/carboxypeptidase family protein
METRRRPSLVFVLVVCGLAFVTSVADAQSLGAALVGTVQDAQGGVLPGAVIRVTSAALMTGSQHTAANERGEWRFPVLPPGDYVVTVERAPDFAPYKNDRLTLGAGQTLELSVQLQPAGISQSVTVPGDAAISSRNSGLETRFGADYIRTIPSRRFSMFDLIKSTPGVSPTSPSSGTVNTVSVFGSAVNENTFLIDGTNFTCPCQGVSRSEPIVDVIQEVQVQSIGASVEYGNMQGAVFNVVTKQGSARVTADGSYYAQTSGLTAQPVVIAVPRGSQPSSGYERDKYQDLTTSVGGPIKSNRAWFFGAYQFLRDYDSQPGADPAFPRRYEQDKFFGKLTWRLTPSMQMMNSYHRENWVNPTAPTFTTPYLTTQRVNASVPSMTFAHLTHVLSDRTVWEARVGRFLLDQNNDPSSGDRTTPPRRDQTTGVTSGNAADIGGLMLDRLTAKAVLNRYESATLGGDHHIKAGAQYERGEHRLRQVIPGGVQYIDDNSAPFQAVFREPSIAGGVFHTSSLFASDSMSVANRVTADFGLRFDHSRAISQDLPVVDAEGAETNASTEGLGTIFTWNVLSPRLGVIYKIDAGGRTLLRASYGRFAQGVLTGELDPISPGIKPRTTMAYDAATGGYTRLVSVVDPKLNLAIDRNMDTPHTDEFSVALDRQIAPTLRASAAYVRKRGSDFIGWTDTGGQYVESTRQLTDGTSVPVFVLTNGTAARRFLLTNPEQLNLEYDGLVAAVERPLSNGWRASASYTYSRAYGLQVISNGTADAPQFSTIARPGFLTFGQDPNDLTNATGRLPNDRPHIFRATGSWLMPWQRILVAANLQTFSGKPWAATTQITLPQGSQRIMLEPRGTRRLDSQAVLDARVSKTVQFRSSSMDLIFDVLNVLNETAGEALASDNKFSTTTFGKPTQFVDPRRAMIGVRLNLGR